MSREWKPGDVALVEAGCWANRKVALRLAEGWSHENGVNVDGDGVIDVVRPLVVIDAEDREQVERLGHALYGAGFTATTRLADALREFANPTPPKPEEPTGLGAVVEDANYTRWTRVESGESETRNPWYPAHDPSLQPAEWSDLAAVRVLSEGVQP